MLKAFRKALGAKPTDEKKSEATPAPSNIAHVIANPPDSAGHVVAELDIEANAPVDPSLDTRVISEVDTVDYSIEGIHLDQSIEDVEIVIDGLSLNDVPAINPFPDEPNRDTLVTSSSAPDLLEASNAVVNGQDLLTNPNSDTESPINITADTNNGTSLPPPTLDNFNATNAPPPPPPDTQENQLQNVVYLMEEDDRMDSRSVVSDAMTEEALHEELQGLSRAITAMEEEAGIVPSSPSASSVVTSTSFAPSFGASPSSKGQNGFAASTSPYDLCRLYNDLGLRLMDAKDYDQSLVMLRKAEALVDSDAPWATYHENVKMERAEGGNNNSSSAAEAEETEEELLSRRARLKAITYNNLGCLFKRRALPQHALGYLQKALVMSEHSGQVHNCSSTHLNICAAYSALKRYKDALAHAERAIVLLQRHLWGPTASTFSDGIAHLSKELTSGSVGERQKLLASASVLAMAYHNAAFEHERLGRYKEAAVSYARAVMIGSKFLGPKSPTTVSLTKAQKAFNARYQKLAASGSIHHHGGHASSSLRKAPSTISHRPSGSSASTAKGRQAAAKKSLYSGRSAKSATNLSSLALLGKGTLPLDKAEASRVARSSAVPLPSSSKAIK